MKRRKFGKIDLIQDLIELDEFKVNDLSNKKIKDGLVSKFERLKNHLYDEEKLRLRDDKILKLNNEMALIEQSFNNLKEFNVINIINSIDKIVKIKEENIKIAFVFSEKIENSKLFNDKLSHNNCFSFFKHLDIESINQNIVLTESNYKNIDEFA